MEGARRYDIYSQAFKRDTYRTFTELRERAPVVHRLTLDASAEGWFVGRYEDVKPALRDDRRLMRDPALAGVTSPPSPLHELPVVWDVAGHGTRGVRPL